MMLIEHNLHALVLVALIVLCSSLGIGAANKRRRVANASDLDGAIPQAGARIALRAPRTLISLSDRLGGCGGGSRRAKVIIDGGRSERKVMVQDAGSSGRRVK
jgi:hypothetical protein